MSGYNLEYFIADFADRTLANLEQIERMNRAGRFEFYSPAKTEKWYEVTQLINSFLGLVVLPTEKFKKWDNRRSEEMRRVEGEIWNLLKR